ncbi:IPT/TIG domain-containing protein [Rickettsiella endosymbiont of Dermanyssus gallinae]|uniref:IPT/TIG domain-containing protein n=1 Tax=Rickettsiella endosymbiont of Dermanyssus gallinae TaxID=2856608 RepID=UPI001FE5FD22|nr:IPT/TIG domain-containing protein [Rickettsiella endosymbiont of Dermanyssus gallinae]
MYAHFFSKASRVIKLLLYSQILQIGVVGASPITELNALPSQQTVIHHMAAKKPEQTLSPQPASASSVVYVQARTKESLGVGSRGTLKKKPVLTKARPHALTNKKLQALKKKLKVHITGDEPPRSFNPADPLLKHQWNEEPAMSLSDLGYIESVAGPLAQLAKSGDLSNISLTSQQFGLSGPLSGGVSYSNVTGYFLNAQYILPLAEQVALGLLGEYGPGQYRLNGTIGYGFSPLSQLKVSGEYLNQRLSFQFDSGSVIHRLHQFAYGVRFRQVFESPYRPSISLGGYYARAANKDLPPVVFSVNGLNYLNERRIAGAISSGIDVGTELLLSRKTLLGGNLYFDRVRYGTQLTGATSRNRQGLGGGIKLEQLFGGSFKLWTEASVRNSYDSYGAGASWLPLSKQLGVELSVLGQHVVFHDSMQSNSNVSLQVKWLPGTNLNYDEYFDSKQKQLSNVSHWVKAPAVYMPQVLAIVEQITRLSSLTISKLNPNNGPVAGGNIVTITGSNFVQGLKVFFGGQLAKVIELFSPTMLTVEVPGMAGSTTTKSVDVVIESPDNQQAIMNNGYTYNNLPSITNLAPRNGPVAGGTSVTITGTSFSGASSVMFGGAAARINNVSPDGTQLTVIAPASTASAAVQVIVTAYGGVSVANPPATTYTYVGAPTVTDITPATGPLQRLFERVPVTISGDRFCCKAQTDRALWRQGQGKGMCR